MRTPIFFSAWITAPIIGTGRQLPAGSYFSKSSATAASTFDNVVFKSWEPNR